MKYIPQFLVVLNFILAISHAAANFLYWRSIIYQQHRLNLQVLIVAHHLVWLYLSI